MEFRDFYQAWYSPMMGIVVVTKKSPRNPAPHEKNLSAHNQDAGKFWGQQ
jgi:hypothetical protein